MIITRTPFRISFFGGGTDYPAWYDEEKGAVLATTIDKYCYITCRRLPPFFPHRHRVVYSSVESVQSVDEIKHNAVREALRFMEIDDGMEIHHDGDLPARTGLGSSSSFTVGLLHALYALKGQLASKQQLAEDAIYVEQELIGEHVGAQDQMCAAWGGMNQIDFNPGRQISVHRLPLSRERCRELESHLMLYFTGFSRTASEVAAEQIKNIPQKRRELRTMYGMVDEAIGVLVGGGDLNAFGALLHETWQIKRTLSDRVTTSEIDAIYDVALKSGATGGKLLGAGGGGFFLLFVEPDRQALVRSSMNRLLQIPFHFEDRGSEIIFYEPDANVH